MNSIKIKDHIIRVDHFDWQDTPLGERMRLISVRKNSQLAPIWKKDNFGKNCLYYHWIYTFIYENGKLLEIEIDYNDKFFSKKFV